MSLCLGYGISSGGLNTGGNFTDSSFSCPTDCTDLHRFLDLCGPEVRSRRLRR